MRSAFYPLSSLLASLGLISLSLAAAPAQAQTQDLFVSIAGNSANTSISRFAGTGPGTFSTASTTLTGGGSNSRQGLAFDARGDLFAANFDGGSNNQGSINEFAANATPGTLGAGTPALTGGGLNGPFGLAFDARGDLFAANFSGNSITEFAFNAASGTLGTGTVVETGLNGPVGLAFDARGDLFAANQNNGTVTEFAFNATSGTLGAATTLSIGGVPLPQGLAFDASGDLFTANEASNTITEFAFNATSGTFGAAMTFATTASGLNSPVGLAFDTHGDLFATNFSGGTITEFASTGLGTFGPAQTVETGLAHPTFLAFGPSVSAPVPEASTTVSFSLLLALGVGGIVIAARRRKAGSQAS